MLASSTFNASNFEVCESELGEPEFCDPLALSDFRNVAAGVLIYGVVSFVATILYYGLMDGRKGQTIGRRVVGIRLVDADSRQPIGFGRVVGRQFGKILSSLPCYLGYFWMAWDDRGQTWHDKMVRSIVVDTSSPTTPGVGYATAPSWTLPPQPASNLGPPPPPPPPPGWSARPSSEFRQAYTADG